MTDNDTRRSRRYYGLASVLLLCLMSAMPAKALAYKEFDIPAQPAREAIKLLAQQSGLQIAALADELGEVRTNAVRGRYEPMTALDLLLAGTTLEAEKTGADTVAIRRRLAQADPQPATQPANQDIDEIVVTGTRIKRREYDTLQATLLNSGQLIQQRGYTNVAEALNDTPGFSPSGTNPVGRNQGTFSSGQSFVDLFGLGSQRTLTLVNGRRYVSSNLAASSGNTASPGQQVDLNMIPIDLVDRVETIAIGGAPVYGADAIAGTVNIILKDHFEGISTDLQYGNSEKGDTAGYTARGLFGSNFSDDRGNAVLSLEYNKQDGILLSKRYGFNSPTTNPAGGPPDEIVLRNYTFSAMTEGGLPYDPATLGYITSPTGTPLQFANGGDLVPFVPGADADGSPFDVLSDGGDGVAAADHISLLTPTERFLVNGLMHYDLTPQLRFFMEGTYAHTSGSELSDIAGFAAPLLTGTFLVFNADNPFLSQSARNTLLANGVNTFIVGRNFSDLLDRGGINSTKFDLYRAVAGLKGELQAFGERLSWDFSYNFGRTRGVTRANYINDERLQLAMDAVRDSSGNIVCASGGSCVPINLFGVGAFSDAAADYVLDRGKAIGQNTQQVVTTNISGHLPFAIGGAEQVSFNLGAEHRREDAWFEPNDVLQGGLTVAGLQLLGGYVPTPHNGFNSNEIYTEMITPLISPQEGWRGIKSLSVEGAVRYVDNSRSGGDTTWSAGSRFAPRLPGWGDGISFRGVYTHAIRAPAITELFSQAAPLRDPIADPCDRTQYQSGPNPAVRAANCAAALAQVGVSSPANFDSTTLGGLSPSGFISGNPDLKNEVADSWSIGMVYQSSDFPRFRAALDWSNIQLKQGIESLSLQHLLDACYDNANYPNVPSCDRFRRLQDSETNSNPNLGRVAGDIAAGFLSGYVNTSSLKFSGLIVSAEYDLGRLLAGSVRLSSKLFYRNELRTEVSAGETPIDSVGESPYPRYNGQLNILYERNRLNLLLQTLWTSSVKLDKTIDNTVLEDHYNNIAEYWKFNGTVGFNFTDKLRAQLVVNNLLDTKPTDAQLLSRNYTVYDILGRTYVARVSASF